MVRKVALTTLLFAVIFGLFVSIGSAQTLAENAWSRVKQPLGQIPQAIGEYANGCQLGAQKLAESGQGFVSIRRFRNRFYAQPVTLDLIRYIGQNIHDLHAKRLLVGDLSLPIGGKMPYGHLSHQTGLDVDFWFYTVEGDALPSQDIEPPSMVDKRLGQMHESRWQIAYRDALYAAATYPQTARIFVNPVIKQYLCQHESDTKWLHKLRPWWGHDAHFHVRLQCPQSSPECITQAPIPAGDGCHADLDNWVADQRDAVLNPQPAQRNPPKVEKIKPLACEQLLQQSQVKLREDR